MDYPFYNGYNIDDSNIDCGKIITVDCDGNHQYENLCTLINNCISNIPCCITSDCVKDFLNTLDTQQVGNFVRISATHCLESVPLSILNSDKLVGVDSTDSPGYAEEKIVGCQDISVNKIGTGTNKQLQICYNGPNSMTELNDVDNSLYTSCGNISNAFIGKFLVSDTTNNRVKTECVSKPMGAIYLDGDVTLDSTDISINEIKHFLIGGLLKHDTDNGMYDTLTITSILKTIGGSALGILKCTKTGIYRITMKGNIMVNAGIQAFRIYVSSGTGRLHGCIDSKFGAGPNAKQPMVFRYDKPLNEDSVSHFNMGGETIVYMQEGDIITLGCRVDTNAGTGISPKATIFSSGLSGGTYDTNSSTMSNRSGLSLQMEFLRSKDFDTSVF